MLYENTEAKLKQITLNDKAADFATDQSDFVVSLKMQVSQRSTSNPKIKFYNLQTP